MQSAYAARGESPLLSTQASTGRESESERGDAVVAAAWRALLEARELQTRPAATEAVEPDEPVERVGEPPAQLVRGHGRGWHAAPGTHAAAAVLFELYAPLLARGAREALTIAHLGQSLDGCIATCSGDSDFVTGTENLVHLHRMRALCDAVVVGAETVAADDPQLTTRRVPGPSPVRVVIDPARRLAAGHRVFTDGAAPTLVVAGAGGAGAARGLGAAELVTVEADARGRLAPDAILAALHARGCHAVFVEGGGDTVSMFLEAGVLDRLQVAVAPLVIGRGRPGLRLPAHERLADSLRLAARAYSMGADVLFDCDLGPVRPGSDADGAATGLGRLP